MSAGDQLGDYKISLWHTILDRHNYLSEQSLPYFLTRHLLKIENNSVTEGFWTTILLDLNSQKS